MAKKPRILFISENGYCRAQMAEGFARYLAVGALGAIFVVALAYPNLPSLDALTEYQPKVPLRVFS